VRFREGPEIVEKSTQQRAMQFELDAVLRAFLGSRAQHTAREFGDRDTLTGGTSGQRVEHGPASMRG
jgi:hypothetical protein